MEKKIEITHTTQVAEKGWIATAQLNGENLFYACGKTPEEAQQNARIAASGYLVEELIQKGDNLIKELTSAFPTIKIPEQERVYMALHDFNNLLTKAKTV